MPRETPGAAGVQQLLQLRLKAAGYLGNFIEQKRAIPGGVEHRAASRRDGRNGGARGGGERGLSEQRRAQERRRKREAIHGDDLFIGPRPQRMNGVGGQPFAGAGFTRNQNRTTQSRGVQNLDEQILRLHRFADQPDACQAAARQNPIETAGPHLLQAPAQITEHLLKQRGADGFDFGMQHIERARAHQLHQRACIRKPPEEKEHLQIGPQGSPAADRGWQIVVKAGLRHQDGVGFVFPQF